jgi:hypothetical protein
MEEHEEIKMLSNTITNLFDLYKCSLHELMAILQKSGMFIGMLV